MASTHREKMEALTMDQGLESAEIQSNPGQTQLEEALEHAAISISYSESSNNAELFQLTKYGLASLLLGILVMAGVSQLS